MSRQGMIAALFALLFISTSYGDELVPKGKCEYQSDKGKLLIYNDSADYLWSLLFTDTIRYQGEDISFGVKEYASVTNLMCSNNHVRYELSLISNSDSYSFEVYDGDVIKGTIEKTTLSAGRCTNSYKSSPEKQVAFCACVNDELGDVYGNEWVEIVTSRCLSKTQ